ncbi:MAG: M14 family zinc carboxypeptidase [Thermoanaerobaculia bacterium]|nr:M14 family zinc carboxypeptidase [Thermoanaerobaculia bacterium]
MSLLAAVVLASALAGSPLAPAAAYDPAIPTPRAVLGHELGSEITSPEGIAAYLQALAAAAPDRARLVEYARSWEGRPLHLLAIASPERMARIEEVRAGLARLADPRGLDPAAEARLLRELPVAVWMLHAVHGNEISPSEAALAQAYHLLAAEGDPEVDLILAEAVVLIDPLQNPDGRARFLHQTLLGRAAAPDPEPAAAEHDEPWPGGRGNHYLFDMNRDWIVMSQPETVGKGRIFRAWSPQVVVDLHEMWGDATYFFAPPSEPIHPAVSPAQRRWLRLFGAANAEAFDARGFPYFAGEIFDAFYPGYGESWPLFQGAIGMTFEQASTRGLVFRRLDDSLLTYEQAVGQHFTAAMATLATAARNRRELLAGFLAERRAAVAEGRWGAASAFVLPAGDDPARAERIARALALQGLEVERAVEPLRTGGRSFPAGSFAVPLAQPGGRLARTLLEAHTPLDADFVAEQDRRRRKRLGDEIYDVTAWSLAELADLEAVPVAGELAGRRERFDPEVPAAPPAPLPPARVAYLAPWGLGTASATVAALADGLRVQVAGRPFRLAGRDWAAGTAIFRVAGNPPDLAARLAELAARHGFAVTAADSGFTESGISLGSDQVRGLAPRRVLLAWDEPTSPQSAGWARYVLERRFGQAASAVRTRSLARVDLFRYDVLVLPQGDYGEAIAGPGLERLKAWLNEGGTLVTLGEASRWAAREKVGLLAARPELRDGRPEGAEKPAGETPRAAAPDRNYSLEGALAPEAEQPESTPGALLRVELDPDHWLSAGSDGEIQAVVEGRRVFTPVPLDKGRNAGLYVAEERLVAAGLVWPEARKALAEKAYLVDQPFGRGRVIAFAEDPNFRAMAPATELLFLNAVLLAPSF